MTMTDGADAAVWLLLGVLLVIVVGALVELFGRWRR